MKKIFVFISLTFSFMFSNAEDFLNVPDAFNKQCTANFISQVDRGDITLESLISNTRSQRYWIVCSDRDNNRFYNSINGSFNGKKSKFLQRFFVKQVSGNWLHLFDYIEEEEMGWIQSDKLLLSIYSLVTETEMKRNRIIKASIPRKGIILTSIANANEQEMTDKRYYSHPERNQKYEKGVPLKFQSLFIYKESNGSILLGVSDILDQAGGNKSLIRGWINKNDIQDWSTRVALENSNTKNAQELYGDAKFHGYATRKELDLCLDQNICSGKSNFVDIEIRPTRDNEMRRPIIESFNDDPNIFKIVSVLGNKEGNKELEALLEKNRRLQQKVNIVFVLDATASMRPYYKSIANSLERVIDKNKKIIGQGSLRMGVVVYRDYLDNTDAFKYLPLTTDYLKVKKFINSTSCKSKDRDLPEAQYNSIVNGIPKVGFNQGESNIVVLIGDCGNHIIDEKGYKLNQVIDIYNKYNVNVISFQVNSRPDDPSFFKFNRDVLKTLSYSGKKRVSDVSSSLKVRLKNMSNNTIKLIMTNEGKDDYENMFGVMVYSNFKPSSTKLLESTIESSLTEYMKSIDNNINILSQYAYTGGPQGSEPPPGVIQALMNQLGCTEAKAREFLKKYELTAEAYVALRYGSQDEDTQIPVVLLTKNELLKLKNNLSDLITGNYGISELKKEFQQNVILVCKSIIGQNTSEEVISEMTMNQIWNIILGVDFGHKRIKKLKLNELETELNNQQFKKFYKDFETIAESFIDQDYVHTDPYISRRFSVSGSYLYWIPLSELPGCIVE